jgi:hypothetical protein
VCVEHAHLDLGDPARGVGAARRTEAFYVPYHGSGVSAVDFPASAFTTPL